MTLLLHAIATTDTSGLDAPSVGVRGLPLVVTQSVGLTAWATSFGQPDTVHRADLLAHHALVERLLGLAGAVLPARFPTWIEDVELAGMLAQRQAALENALAHVRDRVELAVSIVWTTSREAPAAPDATPGRRYMLERQQAQSLQDEARALATAIEAAVTSDVVDSKTTLAPHAGVAASVALLVARASAHATIARIRATPEREDVRILVNGPWPPYTFAILGERREDGVADTRR